MNICGCLVHVVPSRLGEASGIIEATPGTEIHAKSDDGRLVVVVEDTPGRLASETIMDLQINGKKALMAGGSAGMGRATAERLAEAGVQGAQVEAGVPAQVEVGQSTLRICD